jgi:hypothetical protein
MSLINEALKRAKEAQANAPAAAISFAHLRPVEPTHTAQKTAGLLLPIVLTLVALGGLFFLWQASQMTDSGNAGNPQPRRALSVAARPAAQAPAPVAAAPTAPTPAALVAAASPSAARAPAPVPPAPANSGIAPVAATSPSPATTISASASPLPPKPAPLRLQAIVFSPVRPSAMISGKTVHVGDRVGGFRVLAIQQDSATLAGAGQTNVLTLSE